MSVRIVLALLLGASGYAIAQEPMPPAYPLAPVEAPGGSVQPMPTPPTNPTTYVTIPAPQPESKPADEKPGLEAVWDNGLFLRTKDKAFNVHFGGMFHYDGAWYDATPGLEVFPGGVGRFHDGVALRRGRFRADGTIFTDYSFQLEFEFANSLSQGEATPASTFNPAVPVETWIQADKTPWLGRVRIGLQKEWFSLEHNDSARFLPFIERSYLFDAGQPTAFNNGRAPGVSTFRTWADDRVFTAIGAYKNVNAPFGFNVGDGEYAVTGRVAGLPIDERPGQRYWMVGGAVSHRDPANDRVQIRARSSVRGAPGPLLNVLADTGQLRASSQTLFNLQTAAAVGRWTMTAEYLADLVRSARIGTGPNLGTVAFQGFYAEGLVFLTGEHRGFDVQHYRRNRVIPKCNLGDGWGAWELGLRYQYLDLDEGGIRGGTLNNVTVGLNWYWNPNMKLQFNYDYAHRDGGVNPLASGQVHGFGTRVAFDF